eukprot:3932031-Rhodomonas_salina.1
MPPPPSKENREQNKAYISQENDLDLHPNSQQNDENQSLDDCQLAAAQHHLTWLMDQQILTEACIAVLEQSLTDEEVQQSIDKVSKTKKTVLYNADPKAKNFSVNVHVNIKKLLTDVTLQPILRESLKRNFSVDKLVRQLEWYMTHLATVKDKIAILKGEYAVQPASPGVYHKTVANCIHKILSQK